jgi:hypothetical protein
LFNLPSINCCYEIRIFHRGRLIAVTDVAKNQNQNTEYDEPQYGILEVIAQGFIPISI